MEWVEIPAQRLLCVTAEELAEHFERRTDMDDTSRVDTILNALYVRHRDGRVFRYARIQSRNAESVAVVWLEPV